MINKHIIYCFLISLTILSACLTPTDVVTTEIVRMKISATPRLTSTIKDETTNTIEPSATFTPTATPIPTLEGLSIAVPDPKLSNPELFDLQNPDAPIPQFANAMKMAGIEVTVDQLVENITFQQLKDIQGNTIVVGSYTVNADKLPYTFSITYNERRGWNSSSKALADSIGLEWGSLIEPDSDLSSQEFNLGAAHVQWLSPNSQSPIGYEWARQQIKSVEPDISNIRIYHLIDPSGLNDWLVAKNYSPEQLREFLVATVKDGIAQFSEASSFVVVNEPYIYPDRLNDLFYAASGNNYDYIELAFQSARDANPNVQLIYNDTLNFSLTDVVEKGFTTSLTKNIVGVLSPKGLIDGVGLQMHIRAANPPIKQDLINTMKYYGVPVYITELDVDLSDIQGPPEKRWALQAQIYKDVLEACIESGVCNSVTVWGTGDNISWLEIDLGKPNADPTLFDGPDNKWDFTPKPAYYAILGVLQTSLMK